jgi:hypothetical protein
MFICNIPAAKISSFASIISMSELCSKNSEFSIVSWAYFHILGKKYLDLVTMPTTVQYYVSTKGIVIEIEIFRLF